MKVTTKGQITLPKAIRKKYGIKPGGEVQVADVGGQIVVRKVGAGDAVERVYGILAGRGDWKSTDELMERLRGRP